MKKIRRVGAAFVLATVIAWSMTDGTRVYASDGRAGSSSFIACVINAVRTAFGSDVTGRDRIELLMKLLTECQG